MRKLVLLLAVAALAFAACGGGEEEAAPAEPAATPPATTEAPPATTEEPPATTEEAPPATTEEPDPCAVESLVLKTPGQLTIGTGNPAFPPWFEGGSETDDWDFNDPNNGQGYEGAFSYAVAAQLGFTPDQVVWIASTFNQSIAPGPKKWDFNLQQISITKKRAKRVDFSVGYFDNVQALLSVEGSAIDGATTFADLADAKLGVPVGTTSFDYVVDVLGLEPAVYDDQAGAIQALKNGQVDGIVTDLYTAFYLRDVEVDKGVIVGQFPPGAEQDQFGLAFEKDSPLVDCVNQAIEAIKADGTLAAIQQEWLAEVGGAPVISG
jgi:polar amino acid transport system substrate-binding protein